MTNIAEITGAMFVSNYASGSDEWLSERMNGIGGSEVGTICGLNRWESPYMLWAKKTGRLQDERGQSEPMEWGTRLEPVILDKFRDEHPELTVMSDVGTWAHAERLWQLANPDAIFQDGDEFGIVEVKTAQFEDDWKEGVPRYYETQVQWYLDVFGFQRAYVIVLFHGNRYQEHTVEANPLAQEANLERAYDFWRLIQDDKAPDFDGALATYEAVRAIHPEIEDGEVELGNLGVEYFGALKRAADGEQELNEVKSRIMDAMGPLKRGLIDGDWVFTRQAKNGGKPYLAVKRR